MKLITYIVMKKIVDCPVFHNIICSHVESFSSNPRNKPSKAESEQAPPTEPKAEEPAAAVPPATGLDLGLDTRAEEPEEGAAVSATSLPPSAHLPTTAVLISSHFSLLIPVSLGPHHFHTCHSFPSSNGLYSFDSESLFSYFLFFKKGRYPETWSNTVMLPQAWFSIKGTLNLPATLPFMVKRW